jgi:hypothetical protein
LVDARRGRRSRYQVMRAATTTNVAANRGTALEGRRRRRVTGNSSEVGAVMTRPREKVD